MDRAKLDAMLLQELKQEAAKYQLSPPPPYGQTATHRRNYVTSRVPRSNSGIESRIYR